MVRYEIVGREQYTKVVKSGGSSGIIYVPKRYVGHQVVVIIDGDIAIADGAGVRIDAEIPSAPPLADKELTVVDNELGLDFDNTDVVKTTLICSEPEKSDAVPPLENFGKKVLPPNGDAVPKGFWKCSHCDALNETENKTGKCSSCYKAVDR